MSDKDKRYVKTGVAAKHFGVSHKTLERWRQAGKINAINPTGGCWYYSIPNDENQRHNFLYARVSFRTQLKNLDSQCEYLRQIYPDESYTLIRDIGSGMNINRKGLEIILQHVYSKTIGIVVIACQDRLSRFNFELLDKMITNAGGQIIVLHNSEFSYDMEIIYDIFSIISSFSVRLCELKKYQYQLQNDYSIQSNETF